jgi:hypothetical protein
MTTSTWSQDVARGLAHPDSIAARRERIAAATKAELARQANLNAALNLIRHNLGANPEEVVSLLHAISSTFARHHGPSSYGYEVVELLDEVADKIEFKEEA